MICINCGKETENPKFCSRSCSTANNNRNNPRRKKTNRCKTCGELIISRNKYCDHCRKIAIRQQDMTVKEAMYTKYENASRFALIRNRARELYGHRKACEKCGYDKHVEICHINPISSFSLDTMVSVVNSEENIIVLCPNCHWEFDHPRLAAHLREVV